MDGAVLLPMAALTDLVPPTLTAMSANAVEEDRQGMVQGVIASLSSLAAVLAPLVFTPLFGLFISGDLGRLPAGRAVPVLRRAGRGDHPSARDADAARSAAPHAVRVEPLVDRHQRRRVEER
jgi:hypothetical protein